MSKSNLCILLLISSIALAANAAKLSHKLRKEPISSEKDTELAGVWSLTGTKVTEAEPYCYYIFRDNRYKRCLDADSGNVDSKTCRSDDDQKW